MTEFEDIVKLRNQGKTQEEIGQIIGKSRKTVGKYLRSGKIPKYKRTHSGKKDKILPFMEEIKELYERVPKLTVSGLYEYLKEKGYDGSKRQLERRTKALRDKARNKSVYFERTHKPGEIIEGDFTTIKGIEIAGKLEDIHLWVSTLTYSNAIWATPFYYQTFDCFAEGSMEAFEEFGGVAEKYRLDNMKPAVKKILHGAREVTSRYRDLQDHYDFKQDFCNKAAGNEKGDVESGNNFLKRKIREKIKLHKITFSSLDSFKEFTWKICRELNKRDQVRKKFSEEHLNSLPENPFGCYQSRIVKVDKYSLFKICGTNQKYSAPSKLVGLTLEARIYPSRVQLIYDGDIVAEHKRLHGKENICSIDIKHIIKELCKKPGVVFSWTHKECLFKNETWIKYYERLKANLSEKDALLEYLKSLKLLTRYRKEDVAIGMELLIETSKPSSKSLEEILSNRSFNPMDIKPLKTSLVQYDELLKRRENFNDKQN